MTRSENVVVHDFGPTPLSFREAVFEGLDLPQKKLPCQFFYDARGSRLFDEICHLPEYYPTRTELGILETAGPEIGSLLGKNSRLIEFGCGSSRKIITLLKSAHIESYIPIDISKSALMALTRDVGRCFPDLPIHAVCADFTLDFEIPEYIRDGTRNVGFYPGSTIGNFRPDEAREFMARIRRLLGHNGLMIIGVDLQKDPDIIERAYNDTKGVTSEFNRNLLHRINRELNGSFRIELFSHRSFYDPVKGRVEMHLVSTIDQEVLVDGRAFGFLAGETIHTENSYKYTLAGFKALAEDAGFSALRCWVDPGSLFSVHALAVSF